MRSTAAIFQGQITDAQAFTTLLTVESLLFAGLGVALTLSTPQAHHRRTVLSPQAAGAWIASFITLVALSAVLMWTSVFAAPWPCDVRGAIVALVVLATIVGQAGLAWFIAIALGRRGTLPPRNDPPARN